MDIKTTHIKIKTIRKIKNAIYWVSQKECARLQEGVPYGKVY
jgi:hypothetical protein